MSLQEVACVVYDPNSNLLGYLDNLTGFLIEMTDAMSLAADGN